MNHICIKCGKTYDGGTFSYKCPECRRKAHAKQVRLNRMKPCYAILSDGSRVEAESEKALEELLSLPQGSVYRHIYNCRHGRIKHQKYFFVKDEM